tara:strand:+ start:827 stop:3094 length:2268 start_codon:yes stop_codon:yes gene_type:complete
MKGGVFIDYTVAPDFKNGIVYFVDNSTCRVLSDSSIGAVVVQLSLNDDALSPFKKYSSSSASAIEIRNLVIKIMPTNANGGVKDGNGRLRIPCRRNNILNHLGFEKCEKVSFETEVITHSYVYWNTMLNNGDYGFGESCTCALIHAHFPENPEGPGRRGSPTESEIIQSLRRLASNNYVRERTIRSVIGHAPSQTLLRRLLKIPKDDAPKSDKELIMNILSTNPAIIVMESLDDCETLFDFIDRKINTETKRRCVASVLFEILKFTKYTRMCHVDLHYGNIMITKSFQKAYWGRGTGSRLDIANVDDAGHDYPRAFIIDFGRINLLKQNQPTHGSVSESTIINYNGSDGLVDNLLDIVRGYEPREFLRELNSNLVDFRYIENLKSYRMKSTYNWCFVLLNNIIYSRSQNSPLEMYREKALNRFQDQQEVSLPDCIVFIEEIMKDRLLNFRRYRESTVFGIPGVDIYFFQNQGTDTFREKLKEGSYIPQIPIEMGERLTLPYVPGAKDETRLIRNQREEAEPAPAPAQAEPAEEAESESEAEVARRQAENGYDMLELYEEEYNEKVDEAIEYMEEKLYQLQENAGAAGNAVVGFFYNLFNRTRQNRQRSTTPVRNRALNQRSSNEVLNGGSIMNNSGNEFELTNDLDMFLSNLTYDETVMNILHQSVLDFPKKDAEKLGKLFLSGKLNIKTKTQRKSKTNITRKLPTKLQNRRSNYDYTRSMPPINTTLRSLVSTAAGGTRKRVKKKHRKSKKQRN